MCKVSSTVPFPPTSSSLSQETHLPRHHHVHKHTCGHMHTRAHKAHTHSHTYIRIHALRHMCTHAHRAVHTCSHTCTQHMHTYTYAHSHAHTYMHTVVYPHQSVQLPKHAVHFHICVTVKGLFPHQENIFSSSTDTHLLILYNPCQMLYLLGNISRLS